MWKQFCLFAALALTVGCVPSESKMIWRAGSSLSQIDSDTTSCEVAALKEVPRAMAVGVTPTYTTPTYVTPTYTNCYGYGYGATCTTTGGQISGGQTFGGNPYSYDANSSLRTKLVAQCMAKQGYQVSTFPYCTKDQEANAVSLIGARLPDPTNVACVTRDENRIVLIR